MQHPIIERVLAGEPAAACSLAWYEFWTEPVAEGEVGCARSFLAGSIPAVTVDDATLAARLFNAAGRARRFKTDTLIAALAIRAGADFVTINVADFNVFTDHGLRLVEAEV